MRQGKRHGFTSETARKAGMMSPKSLDERCVEMKARMEAEDRYKVEIPRRFIDPEARRLRLKAIRERTEMTQSEMANAVGSVLSIYKDYECGIRTVPWPVSKLAEVVLKRHIIKVKKRRWTARKKILASPPTGVPDDPALRAEILSMHVRGVPVGDIALRTALRLDVVEYVLALVESRGYNR